MKKINSSAQFVAYERKHRMLILFSQIALALILIGLWEVLARLGVNKNVLIFFIIISII